RVKRSVTADVRAGEIALMIVTTKGGLHHPGDQRRSTRRTDRSGGEGLGEGDPFAREPVERRRVDRPLPIRPDVRRSVLRNAPEDIWPWSGERDGGQQQAGDGKEK